MDEINVVDQFQKDFLLQINELYSKHKLPESHLNSILNMFKDCLSTSNKVFLEEISQKNDLSKEQYDFVKERVENSVLNTVLEKFGTMKRVKVRA